MITSFYNEYDLEAAKSVSNEELNKLLQEVRSKDDRYYLLERKVSTKQLFRKPLEKMIYTLLYQLSGQECQIINFCQDHEGSINTSVSASYIYTLFVGFLNGHQTAEQSTNCNCKH